jgi:hypothetical protein
LVEFQGAAAQVGTLLVLLMIALAGGGPAEASKGVRIDVGRIAVEQRLAPGGSYRLPVIGVSNPGTQATTYRMGASYVAGQKGRRPAETWFRFSPGQFTLAPGRTQAVKTRLDIPTGAEPGDYAALVEATIVSDAKGAQVGAAAAARLTFTVEPSNWLEAWWLKLKTWFSDQTPWSWLVPALVLGALLAWWVGRRFSFQIERRA